MAHIWAGPPSEGDDYIFHCHPPEQKIPKPKRLQDWYKRILDRGITEKIVVDYKDMYKQAQDDNMKTISEIPYFEGDFWPNIFEEQIKALDDQAAAERHKEQLMSREQGMEDDGIDEACSEDLQDLPADGNREVRLLRGPGLKKPDYVPPQPPVQAAQTPHGF